MAVPGSAALTAAPSSAAQVIGHDDRELAVACLLGQPGGRLRHCRRQLVRGCLQLPRLVPGLAHRPRRRQLRVDRRQHVGGDRHDLGRGPVVDGQRRQPPPVPQVRVERARPRTAARRGRRSARRRRRSSATWPGSAASASARPAATAPGPRRRSRARTPRCGRPPPARPRSGCCSSSYRAASRLASTRSAPIRISGSSSSSRPMMSSTPWA